ncbi:MAG: hypothetical protein WCS35_09380, partial [Sphaerochaeta sp.]
MIYLKPPFLLQKIIQFVYQSPDVERQITICYVFYHTHYIRFKGVGQYRADSLGPHYKVLFSRMRLT